LEPPSSSLTDDYFSLGIVLILILFSYSLLRGIQLFSLSSDNKEDKDSLRCSFMQGSLVLRLSALIIVLEILRRIIIPQSHYFLFYLLVLITATLLLTLSGIALYGVVAGRDQEWLAKRTGWFISIVLWLGVPLNKLIFRLRKIYSKVADEVTAQSIEDITEVDETMDKEEVEEKLLLKGIVELQDKSVIEIMTPRVNVASLDVNMSFSEVIEKAIDCGFSRLPVYDASPDNVVGFLYVKDLVGHLKDKNPDFNWHIHIRNAYFVPGSKKLDNLLEEFRQKKIHLAMVADEYGGTDGIVTLEDILEEIVGEISDESDI